LSCLLRLSDGGNGLVRADVAGCIYQTWNNQPPNAGKFSIFNLDAGRIF
jgi:hypothetical protein